MIHRYLNADHEAPSFVCWDDEGVPCWVHDCDRKQRLPDSTEVLKLRFTLNEEWTWNVETDTVNPSLLCTDCGTHGFWEQGIWRSV